MIAVIQRCSQAQVRVADQVVGQIGTGLVILLGVHQNDTEEDAAFFSG